MSNHKRSDEAVEKILNYLADSVSNESDEITLAEASQTGIDPVSSAEYTRSTLRKASEALHSVHTRLSNLGHTIDSKWQYSDGEYESTCVNCGSTLSFKTGSHQSQGGVLKTRCPASNESVTSKREA